MGKFEGSFNDLFELVKVKHVQYGDIFEWYKGWWGAKDESNVLVVRHEGMIKNCAGVVRRVAQFCNKQLDSNKVEKIVDLCSFQSMRSNQMFLINGKDNLINKDNFFRKGVVGDWKNLFNKEECKYIDDMCNKHLKPIGLSFEQE